MRELGSAHAKMSGMQHCDTSFVRVVSASLLGALMALGLNGAVLAAGTCLEGPNSKPARAAIGTTELIASIIANVGIRRKQDWKQMRERHWSRRRLQR